MMEFDFDRLREQGVDLANTAKETAVDLANKAGDQVRLLEQQAKLTKAQRQLGALVYSLAKAGEENQPLVDKYIEAIDEIQANIDRLRKGRQEEAPACAPEAEGEAEAAESTAKPCPHCGAEQAQDALFCDKCGTQL